MTARRVQRRRAAVIGFVVGALSLAVIAALGVAGVRSLLNSSAGQTAEAGAVTPVQQFPYSPTGLIGVTDDEGVLTSVAVLVVAPDGTGGTIVTLAASADAGSGTTGALQPLNAELAMGGPEAFSFGAERLTGLSFDVVELVDTERLAGLLDPLGDVTVELETSVYDASSLEEWEAGTVMLGPEEAARLLAARVPDQADWFLEPSRGAVWAAVADRVGAGIGSAEAVGEGEDVPPAGSMDVLVDRLFADRVVHRPLAFTPIESERVEAELSSELSSAAASFTNQTAVVAHDRAETQFVLASVAPSRLGAPLEAATIRLEIGMSDEAVDAAGMTRDDVGIEAVSVAMGAELNVVSVVDEVAPETESPTNVEVAEAAALEDAWDIFPDLFGNVEIGVASVRIDGVDAVVYVGESWLTDLAGEDGEDGDAGGDDESADDDPSAAATTAAPRATSPATTQPAPADPALALEEELNAAVLASPIQFASSSSTLEPSADAVLDELAELLTDVSGVVVVVEGHTDSVGSISDNEVISRARAQAVVAALVERGIAEELLDAEGLGPAEPILVDGVEDRDASRRVEFRVEADG